MPAPPRVSVELLLSQLRRSGLASSRQLTDALGISRETLSQLIRAAGSRLQRFGQTRSIRYGAIRSLPGMPVPIPVHEVDEHGTVHRRAELYPVEGGGHVLQETSGYQVYPGLPPWVEDMRPQGYLGRGFAARHPDLLLPQRTDDWSGEQMLGAIARRGEDCPGALIVGAESLERYLVQDIAPVDVADFPALAIKAGEAVLGSSVGGEFPKFGVVCRDRHVLVKFTGDDNSAATSRWRDLLVCEHLALETLRAHQLAAAISTLHDVGGRRFLEVERFDRVRLRGRRGLLSMQAVYDGYIDGSCATWLDVANAMLRQRLLPESDCDTVALLTAFSMLIGNTDRHFGNLSFLTDYHRHFRLAPAYDILPMALQPRDGRIPDQYEIRIAGQVSLPTWRRAAELAERYWQSVSQDTRVSSVFHSLALRQLEKLSAQTRKFAEYRAGEG